MKPWAAILAVLVLVAIGVWWLMKEESFEPDSGATPAPGVAIPAEGPDADALLERVARPTPDKTPNPTGSPNAGAKTPAVAEGSITGIAVDSLSQPLEGVEVCCFQSYELYRNSGESQGTTRSAADGIFALGSLPLGKSIRTVRFSHPGYATHLERLIKLDQDNPNHANLRVRMYPAAAISGVVKNKGGEPMANVFLLARLEGVALLDYRHAGGAISIEPVRSDAEGKFTVATVPLGPVTLRALAPGYSIGTAGPFVPPRDDVEITLREGEGASLRVDVVRADGETPLAGAHISLSTLVDHRVMSLPSEMVERETDADGIASYKWLPPAEYSPRVTMDACQFELVSNPSDRSPKVDLAVGDAQTMRFRAVASFHLAGKLSLRNGASLASQTIRAWTNWNTPDIQATTSDDGRFEMDVSRAVDQPISLRLESKRYVLAGSRWGWLQVDPQPDEVVELTAVRGVSIHGRVLDESGEPAPGADVKLFSDGGETRLAKTRSDASGAFALKNVVPSDGGYRLLASGRLGSGQKEIRQLSDGELLKGIEIRLGPMASISGTVWRSDGEPVAGAKVRLRKIDPNTGRELGGPSWETICERQGRYRLEGLSAATYHVMADYLGIEEIAEPDGIPLADGEQKEGIDIVLPAALSIQGHVVDAESAPVADVQVMARRLVPAGTGGTKDAGPFKQARSDSNGRFEISGLVAGPYMVWAEISRATLGDRAPWSLGLRTNQREVAAGAQDLVVAFDERGEGRIVGRLVFPSEMQKLAGVGVYLELDRNWTTRLFRSGEVDLDENGQFVLEGVTAGDYEITIHSPQFYPFGAPVRVVAGETADLGTLAVMAGNTLVGRVVDSSGSPIPSALIDLGCTKWWHSAADQVAKSRGSIETSSDGVFRCTLANSYDSLAIYKEGYAPLRRAGLQQENITADTPLVFVMCRAGVIHIKNLPKKESEEWLYRLAFLDPAKERRAYWRARGVGTVSAASFRDGTVDYLDLPPDTYVFDCWRDGAGDGMNPPQTPVPGLAVHRVIELSEGQELTIDLSGE